MLRVNGGKPRKKDYQNCTTPEQNAEEEQPLSILLPQQRRRLHVHRRRPRPKIDGREAMVIAFREVRKPTVDVSMVEDNEDCISFDIEGGMRGKIWIDAETHDVLRLDRLLSGLVDIPLPRKATRRGGTPVLDHGAVGFVDSLQARHV